MRQVARQPEKLMVAPDPAFAMPPAAPEEVARVLDRYEAYRQAKTADRPIVAATVLEKGRVYTDFRPDLSGPAKSEAHARYVATILDALIAEGQALIVFLPHSVEADGNDVIAARHVTEQMKSEPNDYLILEEDCEPPLLKGMIHACDFLVGERTHSLIGSVSVATPFMALTNSRDTRTHGIIGDMCRCQAQIVDMDVKNERAAACRALELLESRRSAREALSRVSGELSDRLRQIARLIRNRPETPQRR